MIYADYHHSDCYMMSLVPAWCAAAFLFGAVVAMPTGIDHDLSDEFKQNAKDMNLNSRNVCEELLRTEKSLNKAVRRITINSDFEQKVAFSCNDDGDLQIQVLSP